MFAARSNAPTSPTSPNRQGDAEARSSPRSGTQDSRYRGGRGRNIRSNQHGSAGGPAVTQQPSPHASSGTRASNSTPLPQYTAIPSPAPTYRSMYDNLPGHAVPSASVAPASSVAPADRLSAAAPAFASVAPVDSAPAAAPAAIPAFHPHAHSPVRRGRWYVVMKGLQPGIYQGW